MWQCRKCSITTERAWHVLVNVTVRWECLYRRQANHARFESWFYCFILGYTVNTEQRVNTTERVFNICNPNRLGTFMRVSAEWAVALSCRMMSSHALAFPKVACARNACAPLYTHRQLTVEFTSTWHILSNVHTLATFFGQKIIVTRTYRVTLV
jgi:hypothetical protein